jgi:hypothetical protein
MHCIQSRDSICRNKSFVNFKKQLVFLTASHGKLLFWLFPRQFYFYVKEWGNGYFSFSLIMAL